MHREVVDSAHTPPSTFGLYRDPWGRLGLIDADGQRHAPVEPIRMFPISDPQGSVGICDDQGHEIACIENLERLPPEMCRMLKEELARREFVPNILQILALSNESDPCQWQVETDRGPTRFYVGSEDDVRLVGPSRALIVDTNGIRYLVEDTRSLDPASRRILERYL